LLQNALSDEKIKAAVKKFNFIDEKEVPQGSSQEWEGFIRVFLQDIDLSRELVRAVDSVLENCSKDPEKMAKCIRDVRIAKEYEAADQPIPKGVNKKVFEQTRKERVVFCHWLEQKAKMQISHFGHSEEKHKDLLFIPHRITKNENNQKQVEIKHNNISYVYRMEKNLPPLPVPMNDSISRLVLISKLFAVHEVEAVSYLMKPSVFDVTHLTEEAIPFLQELVNQSDILDPTLQIAQLRAAYLLLEATKRRSSFPPQIKEILSGYRKYAALSAQLALDEREYQKLCEELKVVYEPPVMLSAERPCTVMKEVEKPKSTEAAQPLSPENTALVSAFEKHFKSQEPSSSTGLPSPESSILDQYDQFTQAYAESLSKTTAVAIDETFDSIFAAYKGLDNTKLNKLGAVANATKACKNRLELRSREQETALAEFWGRLSQFSGTKQHPPIEMVMVHFARSSLNE
jgi:hypothetical protein